LKSDAQIAGVDQYLKNAYLPALHRAGVEKVGVFKPLTNDTAADKRIVVFIPMKSMQQIVKIDEAIWKDAAHETDGAAYINTAFNNQMFERKETILLKPFDLMTDWELPKITGTAAERIYELRSYESASEKLHHQKVKMFNAGGEIALFKRLNFNAVFYSKVVAGAHMPNLMYMTSFNNIADREAHWNSFKVDPEWKKLSAMDEYKNTVSKNEQILMHATEYSDF